MASLQAYQQYRQLNLYKALWLAITFCIGCQLVKYILLKIEHFFHSKNITYAGVIVCAHFFTLRLGHY